MTRSTRSRVGGSDNPAKATPISRRRQANRGVLAMSLNLTPMIDLVFLLLFFFMSTSRFGSLEGMLPAQLPTVQAAAPSIEIPLTPIRVRIADNTGIDGSEESKPVITIDRLHESPVAPAELVNTLRHIRENEPGFDHNTPVHLIANDQTAWDFVVNAYNAAMAAEFDRIYFVESQ
jgi:biopolymer transport protein ExbD